MSYHPLAYDAATLFDRTRTRPDDVTRSAAEHAACGKLSRANWVGENSRACRLRSRPLQRDRLMRIGVLLINLGTPDEPTPEAVGRFLREFLMDEFVLDIPAPLRWFLVNVVIVPRRQKQSARLYQKIHTEHGSPLLIHSLELAERVAARLSGRPDEFMVQLGMRYGNPSIGSALAKLFAENVERVIVLPLYPQYAESSFETAVLEAQRKAYELGSAQTLGFLSPFYDRPEFIDACARRVADYLKVNFYTWSFQSRFGRAEWIGPSTEGVFRELGNRGIKSLAVFCPSFVADCLETLEEIAIRGRETFIGSGGRELSLIPALNTYEPWVESVTGWITELARK